MLRPGRSDNEVMMSPGGHDGVNPATQTHTAEINFASMLVPVFVPNPCHLPHGRNWRIDKGKHIHHVDV